MTSVRVLRCITYSKYFNPFVRCAVSGIKPVQLGHLSVAPMPRPLLSCGAPIEVPCRGYAKGRDKAKGRKSKSVVDVSEEDMAEVINYGRFRKEMEHAMREYREDLLRAATVRTSVASLEGLEVELEGDKYPLNEIAQVVRKSPQMVVINCSAFPQATKSVLETVRDCGMNLNPQQEGTTVAVPIPKVSKEHREGLVTKTKAIRNKCKDDLRKVQNNFQRKAREKEAEHSMDLILKVVAKIKEINDDYVKEADAMLEAKNKELLQGK